MKRYIEKHPDIQPKNVPGAAPDVEGRLVQRIRWLIVWRLFIVTSLLGFVALIDLRDAALLTDVSRTSLYAIIILTYLLTIVFVLLLKLTRAPILNVYIQSMADALLITALVYITGGIRSVHAAFYPLVIAALVHLRAQRVHRAALAGVEHAHLDQRIVRGKAHLAAHGVELAYEVPLARAADSRVARHQAHGVEVEREKERA